MITQCSIRHLYALPSTDPAKNYLIDRAKMFERRRCGHLPEEHPEPLSTHDCISSVVDPKGTGNNKHRYVVASQDLETRKKLRTVKGVPLVYINRSVMIMEPMAGVSVGAREGGEKAKFRDGLKRGAGGETGKRKRDDDDEGTGEGKVEKKKKKAFGAVKGPNPLSVKKSKKVGAGEDHSRASIKKDGGERSETDGQEGVDKSVPDGTEKKRRRRKHKPATSEGGVEIAASGSQDGEP